PTSAARRPIRLPPASTLRFCRRVGRDSFRAFHPNSVIIHQINGSRSCDEAPFFQSADDLYFSTGFQADAHRRENCTTVGVNREDTGIVTEWIYDGHGGHGQRGFFYPDTHETRKPR